MAVGAVKAMVLAAGEGTRIRAVTYGAYPKPMVPLGEGPLLAHIMTHVTGFGVDEVVVNLHHRGDIIRDYFGDRWGGTPVHYSEEAELRGTAGGVAKAADRFDDTLLLVYGDILTDLDLAAFHDSHRERDADMSMLVYEEDRDALPDASIAVTEDRDVTEFIEKPSEDEIAAAGTPRWTNGSVFLVEPEMLDLFPAEGDIGRDVLPRVAADHQLHAYPLPDGAYWREVGTPERYRAALADIARGDINPVMAP